MSTPTAGHSTSRHTPVRFASSNKNRFRDLVSIVDQQKTNGLSPTLATALSTFCDNESQYEHCYRLGQDFLTRRKLLLATVKDLSCARASVDAVLEATTLKLATLDLKNSIANDIEAASHQNDEICSSLSTCAIEIQNLDRAFFETKFPLKRENKDAPTFDNPLTVAKHAMYKIERVWLSSLMDTSGALSLIRVSDLMHFKCRLFDMVQELRQIFRSS